jgi:hypothetical protein
MEKCARIYAQTAGALCICRILVDQKKPVSSLGSSPLCENWNSAGAHFPGVLLLLRDAEPRWSLLTLPSKLPHTEIAPLRRGASPVFYCHAGENCSAGNPPPRGNPGLKCTRIDTIWTKFVFKWSLNLK